MDQIKQLITDISNSKIAPIYFLWGNEPYFIDKIADFIEKNVLPEEEKGFNQVVLYGKDIEVEDLIGQAKRYPMMAERQVIIVKEAQHLKRNLEKLEAYCENPQPTTVLVFCFKYDKLDKRKKVFKLIQKNGVLFESQKLYENKVGEWIKKMLEGRKYSITPKAVQMLVEFLGNDLSRINNELEKLQILLPPGSEITPKIIEDNIGISKDYNNFELRKAIGERDVLKATRIIQYFEQNQKDNPFVVTVGMVFNFFTQLLQYHGLNDHSKKNVAAALKINPFFVPEYALAARNYPMKKVSQIISSLREIDMKGKGVGAGNLSQGDLLKELLTKIMM